MRVVARHVEDPRPCSYLSDKLAQLETVVIANVGPRELEAFLVRGVRRFGPAYFRPRCTACSECVSIRVPVATFAPSKSQRRAVKAASAWRREERPPIADEERLALYRRWHAAREDARGWDGSPLDAEGYEMQFAFPHPCAREVTFRDPARGDRLVAVGLWDVTPNARSAVYCFFDPEYARASPGVVNIVLGIEAARAAGQSHVYLGYRVKDCPSLSYKSSYRPHELLFDRPRIDETPRWVPGEGRA